VIPKKASIPGPYSIQHLAPPLYPSSIVFSRDDGSGAGKAPAPSRIMIVEDDFLVAFDMEAALTEAGFMIAGVASSAEEALELAEAHRPVLAVMDIRLAGQRDGIDAALDLFGTHGIRCVFASAHHDEGTRARAQPARPHAWVTKPYAMASLIEAVRVALQDLRGDKK
jgi:DNA-binding NarL/FixJ family response regulator